MQNAALTLVLGLTLFATACSAPGRDVSAAGGESQRLAGTVTSAAEGAMEGVLVTAKAEGSTVSVTVVSDAKGRYEFPEGRLQPGRYRMRIRAVGYDLQDPGPIDLATSRLTEVDLTLKPTGDLASQLTSGEWLLSIEGTPGQESGVDVRLDLLDRDRCSKCHSLGFTTRSGHDAEGWLRVLDRMRFHSPSATVITPADHPYSPRLRQWWGGLEGAMAYDDEGAPPISESVRAQAEYLASINLSASPDGVWKYPLRTYPRPKGEETKVIITEYDLPRPDTSPHDAAVAPDGMVWYQDFTHAFIGRLNPRSGEVKEWRVPLVKPNPPYAEGGLDVQIDSEGNPWFAIQRAAALLRFEKDTEKMTFWTPPPPHTLRSTVAMIAHAASIDMVWFSHSARQIVGLDLKTNSIAKVYDIPGGFYGIDTLSDGNVMFFSMGSSEIGIVDARTGQIVRYKTPTPNSGPRRGQIDSQDRAWFAEYLADKIAMFDSKTKQFKEWAIPVPYADAYDVVLDRNGEAWSGGMGSDFVFRLNPNTGKITKYLLPSVDTNIRRIDVDNSAATVGVWVGVNRHGRIARLETLEK